MTAPAPPSVVCCYCGSLAPAKISREPVFLPDGRTHVCAYCARCCATLGFVTPDLRSPR